MVGGMQDPYLTINVVSLEECIYFLIWPNVEYPDIYNYFITTPSSYTSQMIYHCGGEPVFEGRAV